MPTCCGDLECALGALLTHYIREVRSVRHGIKSCDSRVGYAERPFAQLLNELAQASRRSESESTHSRRFADVGRWEHERSDSSAERVARHRQRTSYGAQRSIEAELANEQNSFERARLELTGGNEDAKRDRQIVRCTLFSDVSWREIHRDATWRHVEAGVEQSRADPLSALLHRIGSETDDRPLRKARCRVYFNDYFIRVDADERG
jgi:hypothetical protein